MANRTLAPTGLGTNKYFGKINKTRHLYLSRDFYFKIIVIVPTLISIFYYGFLASNRYVSEAYYVVKSVDSHRASGLQMLFQTFGLSRTVDDANAVESYLLSRDAVRVLDEQVSLRKIFGRSDIDIFARFPRPLLGDSFEALYRYYLDRVSVVHDATKGISELRVVAFDPHDAQKISKALLAMAEEFVNRMNDRARLDAVKFARDEQLTAERRLAKAERLLADYRNKEQLLDPTAMSASVLETMTTLSTQLAAARMQQAAQSKLSPDSPGAEALADRIQSLETAIAAQRHKMAGDNAALAGKFTTYENLVVDEKLAESELSAASDAMLSAQQDARRQSLYLEEIVTPNLPDESTEPESLRLIATVFVLSFSAAAVIWLIMAGAREHMIE